MTMAEVLLIIQLATFALKKTPEVIETVEGIIADIKGGKDVTSEEVKSRLERFVSKEYKLVERDPPTTDPIADSME